MTETKLSKHGDRIWAVFSISTAGALAICIAYWTQPVVTSVGLGMDIVGVYFVSVAAGTWNTKEHAGHRAGGAALFIGFGLQIAAQWI